MAKRRMITHNGQTKTVTGWAKSVGMSRAALSYRLDNGWSLSDAITIPIAPHQYFKAERKREVQAPSKKSDTLVPLLRANMAAQREFTRTLRQFNRELMLLMSRSHDVARLHAMAQAIGQPDPSMFGGPGVVSNFAETLSDRSLPSAQETSKLEKFQ